MKKLSLIATIIMMCVLFCACAQETVTETENTAHTLPPTQSIVTEPEWAEIDCDIALLDNSSNLILSSTDFETFAVVGSTDDDSYILLKVSEQATEMLLTMQDKNELYITVNGEVVASANIDTATFDGEITVGEDMTYDSLCELATTIRGLF